MTSLIDGVAQRVKEEFERLWQYQDQGGAIMKREDVAAEVARAKELADLRNSFVPDAELADAVLKVPAAELDSFLAANAAKKHAYEAKIAEAQVFQDGQAAQQDVFREVTQNVADQFRKLSPDSVDHEDEGTPGALYRLLEAYSRSYCVKGRQSSAYMLVEFLLNLDYDHWAWLWREWIGACIAVGDHLCAERLIAAVTDGDTPAAHHFAKKAGKFRGHVMVAKAMIALRRDGDILLAHKIADNARMAFGDDRSVIQNYRAISYVKQEVDAGNLKLEMNLGPNGGFIPTLVEQAVPATALLRDDWGRGRAIEGQKIDEPRQIGHSAAGVPEAPTQAPAPVGTDGGFIAGGDES